MRRAGRNSFRLRAAPPPVETAPEKLRLGQKCGGILIHSARDWPAGQGQVEDREAAETFAIDPDPVAVSNRDMFNGITVPSHELTDSGAAVLGHDEDVVAPQMHLVTQLREHVGMASRPWRDQNIGGILPPFERQ